jgi:putative ABC transport system permease protein
VLGTVGAYLALVAWYRGDVDVVARLPYLNRLVIVLGLPALAALGGWLFAGREPPAIARPVIE